MKMLCGAWIALVVTGLAACGGSGKAHVSAVGAQRTSAVGARSPNVSSTSESLAAPLSGDSDGDSSEREAFDSDDYHSMHFGHAADAVDSRAITALVKRYYNALAREDGAAVCSLLLEVVAESLPEGHVGANGEDRSRQCPEAVSGTLAESHRALVAESRTLRVVSVRVRRRRASVILRFSERAARHILLYEEGGRWKIGTLADEDLG